MNKVLITGAGVGMGLACAKKFLECGWSVIAQYHTTDKALKEIQVNPSTIPAINGRAWAPERVKTNNNNLIFIKADFRYKRDIEKLLDFIQHDQINALVNNAAIYDLSFHSKNRWKAIQDILMVNVIAPTLISQTVFENMKHQHQGTIINVSSIAAKYGSPNENIFYGISKRALEAVTRTLAREGAPCQIRVNTVRPGVFNTSFHAKLGRDVNKRREKIPMKRLGETKEIADLIYHLCNDYPFMTNQTVTISGGE